MTVVGPMGSGSGLAMSSLANRIEGQCDELHDKGRRDLFLSETNAVAFVIGTGVYDHLEEVVDRFEDVANEISAIVIENV
jgi:uncharacterized protein Yka (UPF0111/DUF47 family)